ncbi:MAG: hypothetical protein ACYTXA_27675 [Nostoc sp.]
MNKKQVKNSPVYTYDYPVHDYADNSIYLVIYCIAFAIAPAIRPKTIQMADSSKSLHHNF